MSQRSKRGRSELKEMVAAETAAMATVEVNYFNAKKVAKRQDNLRASLDTGDMLSLESFPAETEAIAMLQSIGEKPVVARIQQKAEAFYCSLFEDWVLYFWGGYNVLLTGVGSKRKVLQKFMTTALTDQRSALLEVDGYSPAVRHTAVINTILQDVLGTSTRFSNYAAKVEHIAQFFTEGKPSRIPYRLFLVIHNIDGEEFRSTSVQTLFSVLAAAPRIHIIASVDHVRHRIMWNQQLRQRFNFIYQNVPTLAPFNEEAIQQSYDQTKYSHSQRSLTGILHVLQSVTPNHRSLWRIVAQHQLRFELDEQRHGRSNHASGSGMEYQELIEQSRQGRLVRNFRMLTQQIKELEDHSLLAQRITADRVRLYTVPLSHETIKEVLSSIEE